MNNYNDAVNMIAEERQRQIEVEDFDTDDDDLHDEGQLAKAATCYVLAPASRDEVPPIWPWQLYWWKPTPDNRIKELVKAGALIVAEIERLQRLNTKVKEDGKATGNDSVSKG